MKKLIGLLLAALVLVPGQASAGGSTTHHDPLDASTFLDIEMIVTARNIGDTHRTYFAVYSWHNFTDSDIDGRNGSFYLFRLDASGRGRADRFLYLYYWHPDDEYYCQVQNRDGHIVGTRSANHHSLEDAIYCEVPTDWLDIDKTPKFAVEAWGRGSLLDRAPDFGDGRYRGL